MRAVQLLEAWQAHQRPQRHPLASDPIRRHRASPYRAKGGRPEAGQRLDNSQRGILVLEHERTVTERQNGLEASVLRGHFHLFVSREIHWCFRPEKEDQPLLDGQVIRTSQAHGGWLGGGLVLRALAEQRHLRTRGLHSHRYLEFTAIPQLNLG